MINLETNRAILQGEWKQLAGVARQHWGKLTDDDLTIAQGRWEVLIGRLQAHYGYTRADAETRLDAFVNHWREGLSADGVKNAQNTVSERVQSAKSTIGAVAQPAQAVDPKVKRNRGKLLLITLLIGVGVGYWITHR